MMQTMVFSGETGVVIMRVEWRPGSGMEVLKSYVNTYLLDSQ